MKIGLFTFGGGYAMLSLIEHTCVERKGWITQEEMMDVTVVAESTPGPIAINCATFVGWRQAGFAGALAATSGIVLPSFLVIFAISGFLDDFSEITVIASAFRGIRAAVGILILNAAVTMGKKMPKKIFPVVILISAFAAMLCVNLCSWKVSSVSMMLIAAAVSLALFLVKEEGGKKGGDGK
ncbi:MAG: chromate transporter [Lachnospiraceae bacterium]|nr:chromate transporter [Lachnospiraceae bacterium]